ncbi:MAG: NUDIX hydrolase, partial [bacterium]
KGEVLVLKRSLAEKYCPNFWDLPGGKVEASETLLEAAKREAKEESGLDVKLEKEYFYVYHCKHVELDIYGFKAETSNGKVILSEEHTEFKWVSEKDWKSLKYTSSVETTIQIFFK